MPSPSLPELRVFECAVRTGSISAAARELRLSQQAVSARLRGLERLIGFQLLHRTPAGVTPTAAGDAMLGPAGVVLEAAARLDASIAALSGIADVAALTIAASQTIAAHLLPDWIIEFRLARLEAGFPAAHTRLHTANSEEVIALVRSGEVDLGFIEQPDAPHGLACAVIGWDRMVLAVASGHDWATRDAISLQDIAATPLVSREPGSGTRAAFESAVRAQLGVDPVAPELSLATEAAVRSAVARGVAPAVLSELTVRDDVRLGRISAVQIASGPITRPFSAIWRGGARDLSGPRRELVDIATRHGG